MDPLKIFLLIFLALVSRISIAQNIYISTEQELNFGDLYLSGTAGGTISISSTGEWTSTGEVHLLNPLHHSAAFVLSTDSPTPVQVQVETPLTILTNQKGNKMSLQLDATGSTQHTLQQGFPKHISLGGTLTIDPDSKSSPGDYNGSVLIRVIIYNE